MMRRFTTTTFALILVSIARLSLAQVPVLVATEPAEGSAGVALETTVTFTFDRPLDLRPNGVWELIRPQNAYVQGEPMVDGTRVVFSVSHQPDEEVA